MDSSRESLLSTPTTPSKKNKSPTTSTTALATDSSPSSSSAVATLSKESSSAESMEMERRSRDRALSICRIYTGKTPRYSLLKHLNNVGSRINKHWFVVRDNLLKTDRLLTLTPINCKQTQHIEFVQYKTQDYVALVQPNNEGSLKDVIYGIERNCWNEDWSQKYSSRGKGLPITQVQRIGRQVLEALMFLKERDFPTVAHLHSGNVIVTNGVARLSALENTLLGFTSRIHPVIASRLQNNCRNQLAPEAIDTICFGHMLFEMTAGYELCTFEPSAVNLSDIQKHPQVLECLRFIFDGPIHGLKYPGVEQLILHDLFRNIDLREMRNASVNIFRPDTSIPISKILEGIKCQKTTTPVKCLDMKPKSFYRAHMETFPNLIEVYNVISFMDGYAKKYQDDEYLNDVVDTLKSEAGETEDVVHPNLSTWGSWEKNLTPINRRKMKTIFGFTEKQTMNLQDCNPCELIDLVCPTQHEKMNISFSESTKSRPIIKSITTISPININIFKKVSQIPRALKLKKPELKFIDELKFENTSSLASVKDNQTIFVPFTLEKNGLEKYWLLQIETTLCNRFLFFFLKSKNNEKAEYKTRIGHYFANYRDSANGAVEDCEETIDFAYKYKFSYINCIDEKISVFTSLVVTME